MDFDRRRILKRNESKVVISFLVTLVKRQAKREGGSIVDYGIQYNQTYEWCRGRVSPRFEKAFELAYEVGLLAELLEAIEAADTPLLVELREWIKSYDKPNG